MAFHKRDKHKLHGNTSVYLAQRIITYVERDRFASLAPMELPDDDSWPVVVTRDNRYNLGCTDTTPHRAPWSADSIVADDAILSLSI